MNCINSCDLIKNNILNKINVESLYFYWNDKVEIKKLFNVKQELKYLPSYPYENINYSDLINSDVFIFFKNPKIIYGTFKIKSIIIKNPTDKLFINDDYIEHNKNNIMIDDKIFKELIKKYNIIDIPGLFFIELDTINIFEYEINIKIFNSYFKTQTDFIEFKYPKKVKDIHIIQSYYPKILNQLIEYINYQKNKENENENIDKENIDKKLSITDKSIKNTNDEFCIPILWNSCKIIKDKIKNNTITKIEIIDHWTKCNLCEKNDNNLFPLNIENSKITLKKIEKTCDNNLFSKIIENYQNVKKTNILDINNYDIEFEKNKVNIIMTSNYNGIYDKCFFVIG